MPKRNGAYSTSELKLMTTHIKVKALKLGEGERLSDMGYGIWENLEMKLRRRQTSGRLHPDLQVRTPTAYQKRWRLIKKELPADVYENLISKGGAPVIINIDDDGRVNGNVVEPEGKEMKEYEREEGREGQNEDQAENVDPSEPEVDLALNEDKIEIEIGDQALPWIEPEREGEMEESQGEEGTAGQNKDQAEKVDLSVPWIEPEVDRSPNEEKIEKEIEIEDSSMLCLQLEDDEQKENDKADASSFELEEEDQEENRLELEGRNPNSTFQEEYMNFLNEKYGLDEDPFDE